jgi:hypothetical protein
VRPYVNKQAGKKSGKKYRTMVIGGNMRDCLYLMSTIPMTLGKFTSALAFFPIKEKGNVVQYYYFSPNTGRVVFLPGLGFFPHCA